MIQIALAFFISCNFTPLNAEEGKSIIKIGMEFQEAEKILRNFGAQETALSVGYFGDSEPTTEFKSYIIPDKKPIINIIYEKDNNLIVAISLYYEYEYKGHPDNKWLNVEEMDLNVFLQNETLVYPYIASPERQEFITENYKKIKIGTTANEVKQILGSPDQILPLYEPKIKNASKIGHTFWYILQRLKESGSQKRREEKLVRVSFNLENKVIAIDHWGLDE